ncbi:MAG: putative capsid protein [Circoviridae sp.]|nr:MAG: putative capsid protein [Circoviridae sp.]
MAKKPYKKKVTSTALAKRVKTLEIKQLADDKSTERKTQYYTGSNNMNSVWSSNYDFIVRTTQGTAAEGTTSAGLNRIGTTINLRSAIINFHAKLPRDSNGNPLIPAQSTRCRVLLVDNLTGVEALAISDVLEDSVPFHFTSPYRSSVNRGERYRVLGDFKFNLNASNKADHSWKFKMPLPKSGRVIHYDEGTSVSLPSDFNVTMFWICEDIGPLTAVQPTLQYFVKSSFEDK